MILHILRVRGIVFGTATGPMNLVCSLLGHKRSPRKSWDGEFYHSACVRCSAELVRLSGDRDWREPNEIEKRYFDKMNSGEPEGEPESEPEASAAGDATSALVR